MHVLYQRNDYVGKRAVFDGKLLAVFLQYILPYSFRYIIAFSYALAN